MKSLKESGERNETLRRKENRYAQRLYLEQAAAVRAPGCGNGDTRTAFQCVRSRRRRQLCGRQEHCGSRCGRRKRSRYRTYSELSYRHLTRRKCRYRKRHGQEQ